MSTILQFSTRNGLVVLACNKFIVFSYGLWSIEKWKYGCLPANYFKIKKYQYCCCCDVMIIRYIAVDENESDMQEPLLNA